MEKTGFMNVHSSMFPNWIPTFYILLLIPLRLVSHRCACVCSVAASCLMVGDATRLPLNCIFNTSVCTVTANFNILRFYR
jgi:hypothetical protein